jgi:hypothetical protein
VDASDDFPKNPMYCREMACFFSITSSVPFYHFGVCTTGFLSQFLQHSRKQINKIAKEINKNVSTKIQPISFVQPNTPSLIVHFHSG